MDTSELDYELELDGEIFHVQHDGGNAYILDCEYKHVFSFPNLELWTKGEAMPLALAKIVLTIHHSAYAYGKKAGYRNAQFDIRKALGI